MPCFRIMLTSIDNMLYMKSIHVHALIKHEIRRHHDVCSLIYTSETSQERHMKLMSKKATRASVVPPDDDRVEGLSKLLKQRAGYVHNMLMGPQVKLARCYIKFVNKHNWT